MKKANNEVQVAVDDMKSNFANIKSDLTSLLESAQEIMNKGGSASFEKIGDVSKTIKKSVNERPITSIAVSLAAGYIIGRFLSK